MTETLTPIIDRALQQRTAALLERACKADLSLATAESCTGGLLASLLTDVDGASHAFDRGFVTYTEAAKIAVLGVPATMLDQHGAVSEPVARAMAEGALARSDAAMAVAVTGFAGPGADGDEAGLVHFAVARRDGETSHREEHFGDIGRGPTRKCCLQTAVEMLEDAIA